MLHQATIASQPTPTHRPRIAAPVNSAADREMPFFAWNGDVGLAVSGDRMPLAKEWQIPQSGRASCVGCSTRRRGTPRSRPNEPLLGAALGTAHPRPLDSHEQCLRASLRSLARSWNPADGSYFAGWALRSKTVGFPALSRETM